MTWATPYIARLAQGHSVRVRPRGHSLKPKINDRDLVTVDPVRDDTNPSVDDTRT